ncbi:hypothetical protein [Myxococcus sp. RHSTA-1-4]|uniref:hypothetical protein n=1 Tax=Myxococcus sp. RHSTA-1-4 TaxID=2874601 RepID=UPI001CBCED1B|nr:hypothetical protein [Myxococcus sp. RHSTA-1-4]MBZ4421327.1 hypothetical protein [Myxococcus sp. RHSTA-1-4]
MLETPERAGTAYPAEDLRRYQFHTGAPLRPLKPDEPCPVLYRDLGPVALRRYLRGTLPRLAGPLTPLLYMRTLSFREPYTDYENTGRLVFLRPLHVQPWDSGVPGVYVARATRPVDLSTVAYCPGSIPLESVEPLAREVADAAELREALGGRVYDEAVSGALHALDGLVAEMESAETRAEPLRRALQSNQRDVRLRARDELARLGLKENDLCAAWHHVPRERRALLMDALPRLRLPG